MFVNVGTATNLRVLSGWASWPSKENVISVKKYKLLNEAEKVTDVLADLCPVLK